MSQLAASLLSSITASRNAYRQHQALYAARFSPDFNPCAFIDFNELKISQIIRWLLDPHGSHGQGTRFLSALLDQMELNWSASALQRAKAYAEYDAGDKGRIDVWCASADGVIAIENKLWGAEEGEKQIERYLSFMKHEFGSGRASRLIYLPQYPVDASLADLHAKAVRDKQLVFWSFASDFKRWLDGCRLTSESSRLSAFIYDLSEHLRQAIEGAITMEERNLIVVESCASTSSVHSAMSIIAAERDIKINLINLLALQLQELVESVGWKSSGWCDDNRKEFGAEASFKKWAFIQIDFRDGRDFKFKLSFDEGGHNDLGYGVAPTEGPRTVSPDLRKSVIERFGDPSKSTLSSQWWYWHRDVGTHDEHLQLEQRWNHNPKAWEDVRSGEAAKRIFGAATAFKTKLDGLG